MLTLIAALGLVDPSTCASQPGLSHYDVDLAVDTATGGLAATATVTLAPDQVRAEQTFSLGGVYEIQSATSPDAAIEIQPLEGRSRHVVVRPNAPNVGKPVVFTLRYAGPLQATGEPPLNAITPDLVELNLDGGWTPIRTDYTLRYSACLEIDGLPADAEVATQGTVTRDGSRVAVARETPDFDLTFVAARGLRRVTEGGLEFYAANPDGEIERLYRTHGAGAVSFLEAWLGPLPSRPVRVVVVERARASGYARSGYVVVTRGRGGGEHGLGKFIAHEFAHAWSPAADPMSEHHWLVESTAEYVALRYVEAAFGVETRDAMLEEKRLAAQDVPPILGGGRRGDAVLYAKGCLLLFELENRMGRERMDALMRDFARDRPAVTADFLVLLGRHADPETVAAFSDSLRR